MGVLWNRAMFRLAWLVLILAALFHVGLLLGFDWFGYSGIVLVTLFIGAGSSVSRVGLLQFWNRPRLPDWGRWSVRLAWLYAACNLGSFVVVGWLDRPLLPNSLFAVSRYSGVVLAISWICTCFRFTLLRQAVAAANADAGEY